QNAAILHAGLDAVYVAFRVPPVALEDAVRGLAALGAVGANVTIPHKGAAATLCDSLSAEAKVAGAVNTLVFRGGTIAGHLTDGLGMLDALRDRGVDPAGRPALVLGAGGSARAAAAALLAAGAGPVHVLARRLAAAQGLAASLAPHGSIEAVSALPAGPLGVVAHCTPVGALVELEASPLPADALERMDIVCDFAYRSDGTPTPLVASGRPAIDGLELLVHQGARAFTLFFERDAPLEAMRLAARADR
ncbi:MAG: quinate/shikimate dehydrogenase, partial [Gaiellales bacterium]